jgi:hypothetical protein
MRSLMDSVGMLSAYGGRAYLSSARRLGVRTSGAADQHGRLVGNYAHIARRASQHRQAGAVADRHHHTDLRQMRKFDNGLRPDPSTSATS